MCLDRSSGFFSAFFMVNHYIYSKKYNFNFNFKLDTSRWLFKSCDGWNDYFKSIDFIKNNNETVTKEYNILNVIENDYTVYEYKDVTKINMVTSFKCH